MYQANTIDTTLTGDRKARVAIEEMQERLLDGWGRLGKLLFARAGRGVADAAAAPDGQPLSGYYAGAYDRTSAATPVTSFRQWPRTKGV